MLLMTVNIICLLVAALFLLLLKKEVVLPLNLYKNLLNLQYNMFLKNTTVNNILKSEKKYKARIFFAYSLLIFASWNIVTTWWVSLATVVGAVAAIVCYTLFMSLTMLISFHIAQRNHIVIA